MLTQEQILNNIAENIHYFEARTPKSVPSCHNWLNPFTISSDSILPVDI